MSFILQNYVCIPFAVNKSKNVSRGESLSADGNAAKPVTKNWYHKEIMIYIVGGDGSMCDYKYVWLAPFETILFFVLCRKIIMVKFTKRSIKEKILLKRKPMKLTTLQLVNKCFFEISTKEQHNILQDCRGHYNKLNIDNKIKYYRALKGPCFKIIMIRFDETQ